ILAAAGWARPEGGLTPDGEIALSLARQYRYPVMYLPLLRQVPELLFGEPGKPGDGDGDTHLDRELDLRFSGEVFTAACREPFLGLALPLFEAAPLDRQPALVVDAGCGDGALLEALYLAVRERTARGRRLAERPLLVAGVDPSPVARRMASARLAGDRGPRGAGGGAGQADRADARHRARRDARVRLPVPGRARRVRLGGPGGRVRQPRARRAGSGHAGSHDPDHRPLRGGSNP